MNRGSARQNQPSGSFRHFATQSDRFDSTCFIQACVRRFVVLARVKRVKRQQDRENKDRDTETNTDILPITFVLPLE